MSFGSNISSKTFSLIGTAQNELLQNVAAAWQTLLGVGGGEIDQQRLQVMMGFLTGNPDPIDADISLLEEAAFDNFDRNIAPRLNAQAAGLNATQSSRRGVLQGRVLSDISTQLSGIKFEAIERARQRQLQTLFGPLQAAGQFSTTQVAASDSAASPGTGGAILGLIGAGIGAYFGGPGGAAAGNAAGNQAGGDIDSFVDTGDASGLASGGKAGA